MTAAAALAVLALSLTGVPVATAGTVATVVDEPEGAGDVWSVRPQPDGSVNYTVYRPAPGTSPDELYAALTADGVAGLQDPAADSDVLDPFTCYSGTAYALQNGRCPPARWRWNSFPDPQVYFRDHTPSGWPVRAVVTDWNKAAGVDSFWTSGNCPAGGRHCVHVWSGNYGATGWTGNTSFTLDSSRYFVDGSVLTELNDHYAASAADRRNTACHELGHALGVGHNLSPASCLYGQDIPANPQKPHTSDYTLLRTVIYP